MRGLPRRRDIPDFTAFHPTAIAPDRIFSLSTPCTQGAVHTRAILVGVERDYRRFGFRRGLTSGLTLPGPVDRRRFLGLELVAGALMGARGLVRPPGAVVVAEAASLYRVYGCVDDGRENDAADHECRDSGRQGAGIFLGCTLPTDRGVPWSIAMMLTDFSGMRLPSG